MASTREPTVPLLAESRGLGNSEVAREKFGYVCDAEKFDLASTFDSPGQSKFGPCQKAVRNPAYSDLASDWAKAGLPCLRVQKSDESVIYCTMHDKIAISENCASIMQRMLLETSTDRMGI
jgi:hypothetical protein